MHNAPKELLIHFLVFLTQKPLTTKGGGRSRGGGPMGSSLPNHDAKVEIGQTEKKERKSRKPKGRL